MNITNSSHIHLSQNIQGLHRAPTGKNGTEPTGSTAPLKDAISFSEEALRLSEANQTNSEPTRMRFDLVNRVRAEIAAGTYDTPEKMNIALERMASRIF